MEVSDSQWGQEEVEKKLNGMMGMRRAAAGRSHAEEETDPESEGRALRCSLGLGVYGNSSKHDISSAASRTTPASNNSPAVQWVVKLWPPELSPCPTAINCYQPGLQDLTLVHCRTKEQEASTRQHKFGFEPCKHYNIF